MAKRPPISNDELAELRERSMDFAADLHEASERIRRDLIYADDVVTPAQFAAAFAGLSAKAAELSQVISLRVGNAEERSKLMAELAKR